jgi:hypothetical protein
MKTQIIHCEVRSKNSKFEVGHWFFDTDTWTVCASAGKVKRFEWRYEIYNLPASTADRNKSFKSLGELKQSLEDIFQKSIVRGKFPSL